jgi:hypothetical protein
MTNFRGEVMDSVIFERCLNIPDTVELLKEYLEHNNPKPIYSNRLFAFQNPDSDLNYTVKKWLA